MEMSYSEIEKKWSLLWKNAELYKVEENTSLPKYYVLDMFPYPSGSGLHVGHPLGYVANDIFARYKKLSGFNVLHPMGFDAFGLPAEQYALETGTHPAITTEKNINYFREQLLRMGFAYDWSREVKTADPKFYKWTQWIFMQLFKCWYNPFRNKAEYLDSLEQILEKEGSKKLFELDKCDSNISAEEWKSFNEEQRQVFLMQFRLAYLDFAEVWWCEVLGTVLANDEVKDGVSERGGHPAEKIKMRQWFLRITEYADRLLHGLETLDWSDAMKEMQRNWIGRSEGALIEFEIVKLFEWDISHLNIFTTRPDTIFGATFMVLAPEHELVAKITTPEHKADIEKYISYVKSRSERDRLSEVKKVTGQFTGAHVKHPFNGKEIPIYIAEYVLAGYGTGAIMAVPSNDDRDRAFAEKFNLPIIEVVDQSAYQNISREEKKGKLINSDFLNGLEVKDAIKKIIKEIDNKKIGKEKINYKFHDAGFSRQRYWGEPFPVYYKNDLPYLIDEKELPVLLPDVENYKPAGAAKSPLANVKEWMQYENAETKEHGLRETDTMPGYAGSSWYFYRYMDVHNKNAFASQEKINYWRNVDIYIGGTEHAVGHLLYSRMWNKFLFDLGLVPEDEPFKKLVNQGMIQGESYFAYADDENKKIYSYSLKPVGENIKEVRVNSKFIKNASYLNEELLDEFLKSIGRENYEIIKETNQKKSEFNFHTLFEKMSKSKGNVTNPDDVINEYGADCFRMYEMFLGPIDTSKPWDTKGITGVQNFLKKFIRLYTQDNTWKTLDTSEPSAEELKILHKTIKKISDDIEKLSFNTAVSTFMICVNELSALQCKNKKILSDLLILMAPFAPFITEEIWSSVQSVSSEQYSKELSVHSQRWPVFNATYILENTCVYAISINGKTRDTLELPVDISEKEIEKAALALESVVKWTEGKEPKKVIIVKGKIVNIVN